MRDIPYTVRGPIETDSATRWNVATGDLNFILDQAKHVKENTLNFIAHKLINPTSALLMKNPRIPKQGTGKPNSPLSMCEGILDNFATGQFNLSDKQCIGLQEAFRIADDIMKGVEQVTFTEVDKLPKLEATKSTEVPTDNTFGDLFDVESITITYRRK